METEENAARTESVVLLDCIHLRDGDHGVHVGGEKGTVYITVQNERAKKLSGAGFSCEANAQPGRAIEFQDSHRRAADGCETHDAQALPSEVLAPPIAARIKQRGDLTGLGINPGEIAPLVQVAVGASQRKVFQLIAPAMLAGSDVLDLQRNERRVCLSMLKILAAVASPGPDCGTRSGVHRSRLAVSDSETRFGLQDG